jgi:hypothetical protein
MTTCLIAAVLLLLSAVPPDVVSADSYAADVTGTWDLKVETREGTASPSIILRQEGERITGTYQGRMGNSRLEGSIKGNDINFTVTLKFQDVSYKVTYSGVVSEDTMKGTTRFEGGGAGAGTWSARRRKELR